MKMSLAENNAITTAYRHGISKITKDYALSLGFKTAKSLKASVAAYENKKEARRKFHMWERENNRTHSKAFDEYANKKASKICSSLDIYPANGRVRGIIDDHFAIEIDYDMDWDARNKSYGHPMKVWDITVHIPARGIITKVSDGIFMIVNRVTKIGNLTRYDGQAVYKKRGYSVEIEQCSCVVGNNVSAHAKSPKDAVISWKRKFKHRLASMLRPDKIISARDYMRVTGACEFGTRAFCKEMGYNFDNTRMTVAEVAEITKGRFGHNDFVKAIVEA